MSEFVSVYITAKDARQAREIGAMLVIRRLAACANIFPAIESIYEWKGELVTDNEAALIVKTRAALVEDLTAAVKAAHTYECPCIVAVPLAGGSGEFLEWVRAQTGPADES